MTTKGNQMTEAEIYEAELALWEGLEEDRAKEMAHGLLDD